MVEKAILIISPKTVLPILQGICIQVVDGMLSVHTTNLDQHALLTSKIGMDDLQLPAFIVPARLLGNVLSVCADEVDIESAKNKIILTSGSRRFELNTIGDDFPILPKFSESTVFEYPCQSLLLGMTQLSRFMSVDESRYVFNGLFFEFKEDVFAMVATDGRRLAEKRHAPIQNISGNFILNSESVEPLREHLQSAWRDAIARIEFKSREWVKFAFSMGDIHVEFFSEPVDGHYPTYSNVIPTESKFECLCDSTALISSIRAANFLTSDRESGLQLQFSKDLLELSAANFETGSALVKESVQWLGESFRIAFRAEYLIDALCNIAVAARLKFIDEMSPVVIECATSPDDSALKFVVMPMKLNT